ncbi:MAG: TolB family protein [Verrucomicrobiia bacterium]
MTSCIASRARSRLRVCWMLAVFVTGSLATMQAAEVPRLFPDYVGVTLPPNIAPLNFKIQEPAVSYRVQLHSTHGAPISMSSKGPEIRIPAKAWARLLGANRGEPFYWDIAGESGSGWKAFGTVTNRIAREEIDGWLVYRLLKPIFNYYTQLGIYQRDLGSFEERLIIKNDKFDQGCLNCHMPLNQNPDTFAFHIREQGGKNPMILVLTNQPARVEKTMGYLAWHPSGRLMAFSAHKFFLFFHTRGETRDLYDANSDLGIYRTDSNTVEFPGPIAASHVNETWPAWSPDGRYLYFSSAAPQPREKFHEIRYDLMRVSFDLHTGQWGEPEMMISAAETGQSICQPKVSPDGRYLLVTVSDYGSFPIYQSQSDLNVMDLATRTLRRLDINSDEADTWHSWSSNSRWVVFSSKRIDGLFARPYLSYVDDRGVFHKPLVLPQENAGFYGYCLNTFNVPEFMRGPVTARERDLVRAIREADKARTPEGPARPPSAPEESGAPQIRE